MKSSPEPKPTPPQGDANSPVVRIPTTTPKETQAEAAKIVLPPPLPRSRDAGARSVATDAPGETKATTPPAPNIRIARPGEEKSGALPPPLPPPAPKALQGSTAKSTWMVRSAVFLCLGGALALICWSVFVRLLPVTTKHREKALEMTRVADELERLRAMYSPEEIKEIKARHERAQRALFDGGAEIDRWKESIDSEARMRVLAADVQFEEPKPFPETTEDISIITAQLKIQPDMVFGSTNSPYGRLAKFTDAIAGTPKRVELLELSVVGNSNSVSQAQAVVRLLATERSAQ